MGSPNFIAKGDAPKCGKLMMDYEKYHGFPNLEQLQLHMFTRLGSTGSCQDQEKEGD